MAQDLQTGRVFYYYFYVFYVLLKDAAAFQFALVHSVLGGDGCRPLPADSSVRRFFSSAILINFGFFSTVFHKVGAEIRMRFIG